MFSSVKRIAVAATAGILSLGLAAPVSAQTADPLAPAITWEQCPERVTDPTAQCGRIDVPMYYSDPGEATISVGFIRLPAQGQSRGTLFFNPGGPGGDAYSILGSDAVLDFPQEFANEWDRIAVQPRGLPGSTPVDCFNIPDIDPISMVLKPGEFLRKACEMGTPGYTASITTANTAEDWEMVRRSLGIDKISLLGWSYGTYLASVYATRYPEHTDRVVLDSAIDPSQVWNHQFGSQQESYTSSLHNFLAWVAERNELYGLGTTPLQVYQSWSRKVVAESGTNPTVVPPPARVGDIPPGLEWAGSIATDVMDATGKPRVEIEGLLSRAQNPGASQMASITLAMTRALLPQPREWDYLAKLINGSETADIPQVEPDLDDPEVRDAITATSMQHLIVCNENISPANPWKLGEFLWTTYVSQDGWNSVPLRFEVGAACAGFAPVTQPAVVNGSGLEIRPLLVHGTDDPQTAESMSYNLQNAMGAHRVQVVGPGHGHFGVGNQAVDKIVVDYLRDGYTEATTAPGMSPN